MASRHACSSPCQGGPLCGRTVVKLQRGGPLRLCGFAMWGILMRREALGADVVVLEGRWKGCIDAFDRLLLISTFVVVMNVQLVAVGLGRRPVSTQRVCGGGALQSRAVEPLRGRDVLSGSAVGLEVGAKDGAVRKGEAHESPQARNASTDSSVKRLTSSHDRHSLQPSTALGGKTCERRLGRSPAEEGSLRPETRLRSRRLFLHG